MTSSSRLDQLRDHLLPSASPLHVGISDSLHVAAKRYSLSLPDRSRSRESPGHVIHVLGLHGWLDNAGTFDLLAPLLLRSLAPAGSINPADPSINPSTNPSINPSIQVEFVSMDLIGHGLSAHVVGPYQYLDQIEVINDVIDELGWKQCVLVGHSYGANNALLYAAACPERVQALVMIESWGPVTIETGDSAKKMGLALRERSALRKPRKGSPQEFDTIDEAAKKIHASIVTESPFELSSARILVARNLQPTPAGKLAWCYDPKLKPRGVLAPSEEQVLVFIKALRCPVLMVEGEKGFLKSRYAGQRKSLELQNRKQAFPQLQVSVVAGGGHYPHMDHAPQVAEIIRVFLSQVGALEQAK